MPDLKEKNNPQIQELADKHFDDIVNRPDMQALGDQGDAVARDLKDKSATTESDKPTSLYTGESDEPSGIRGWSRKKKASVGSVLGVSVAGVLLSIFMLLPLKIPGLMQLVTQETAQKVEQITEKRAKTIIARAILTKFGTHTGIVITGEGAFKTLVASMRTNGFEKRLAEKGLVITQTPDGVRLTQNGKPLGGGKNLTNEKAILEALDGNTVSNKVLKDIVKEDIPAWRWMKRAKFASWLRIKYGIPRYGLPNSDKKDAKAKEKEIDSFRAKAVNERVTTSFTGIMNCIMSGSCTATDGSNESSIATDSEPAAEDVKTEGEAFVQEAEKNGLAETRLTTETLSKRLVSKFISVAGSKAIPYIGWADLVASVNHFINKAGSDDYIGKIAAYYKGASYAAIYADWAGYGSQIQLGEMDPEYIGVLAKELDGAEMGQAFQTIDNNPGKGVPIETKVNSDKPSESAKLINTFTQGDLNIYNAQYRLIGNPLMEAYYQTVGSGGALGWVSDKVGGLLGTVLSPLGSLIGVLTPDSVKDKLLETLGYLAPKILKMFGLTIDALDTGAGLLNNIVGGGVVSTNDYCKEVLKCRKLTPTQAYEQQQSIAQERKEYVEQKGPLYALFSPDESGSVTTQLAISMPSSIDTTGQSLAALVTSVPSRLASLVTPKTFAAASATTYEALYGVQPYGATAADLNQPLSKEYLEGEDCPEAPDDTYDGCNVDKVVTEAMICQFKPKSTDCDPDSTSINNASGGTVRVATFNMRGASHTGGVFAGRMDLSIAAINRHKFEIFGAQELEVKQRNYLMGKIGGEFDIFPCASCKPNSLDVPNSIVFSKRFELIRSGYMPDLVYFNGNKLNAPWVLLQDRASGQQLYVLNTHDPAFAENAKRRYENGIKHTKFIAELMKSGIPVVMTGDFNSGYVAQDSGGNVTYERKDANTIYCTMTSTGYINDALDLSKDRPVKCPNPATGYGNPIDHIFASKGLDATNYTKIEGGYQNNGSDHPTYFADIIIPGMEGSNSGAVGDWAWPVDKSFWDKNRADFLNAHSANSGTWTNGVNSLATDISSPGFGKPVYAMIGGTVSRSSLGGHGLEITSKVQGGTLEIAYAHGPRVNIKNEYKAGDKIMTIASLGNSTGPHLHIDMAFNGKGVCPQDIFIALDKGEVPNLAELVKKGKAPCGRL